MKLASGELAGVGDAASDAASARFVLACDGPASGSEMSCSGSFFFDMLVGVRWIAGLGRSVVGAVALTIGRNRIEISAGCRSMRTRFSCNHIASASRCTLMITASTDCFRKKVLAEANDVAVRRHLNKRNNPLLCYQATTFKNALFVAQLLIVRSCPIAGVQNGSVYGMAAIRTNKFLSGAPKCFQPEWQHHACAVDDKVHATIAIGSCAQSSHVLS